MKKKSWKGNLSEKKVHFMSVDSVEILSLITLCLPGYSSSLYIYVTRLLIVPSIIDSPAMPGQVTNLRCWYNESSGRGAVDVKWPSGGSYKYRLGHDGKVDLKYISCTTGGLYYKDSLPLLGKKKHPQILLF